MPGERIVQEKQEQMPGEHIITSLTHIHKGNRLEIPRGKVTVSGIVNSIIGQSVNKAARQGHRLQQEHEQGK